MKDDAFPGLTVAAIIVMALIGFGSVILGKQLDNEEAIRHHAAHYDPTTGDFTWNQ